MGVYYNTELTFLISLSFPLFVHSAFCRVSCNVVNRTIEPTQNEKLVITFKEFKEKKGYLGPSLLSFIVPPALSCLCLVAVIIVGVVILVVGIGVVCC